MRELRPQVAGQPVENFASPRLVALPVQNGPPDVPVKLNHGGIYDALRPLLGLPDEAFQGRESGGVVSGKVRFELGMIPP